MKTSEVFKKFSKYTDIGLACGIIGILLVLLFPVPTALLDLLLAFSIATAVVILMTSLFINNPLDLSVFPTILLVTTLLRLSLNIASTRLILARGHLGTSSAGHVIEAFGGFVMQGNVVIGLIVFLILTLINFIVITKGSGRIAEVAARFSLDAMPGKQMAIDADLSSGLINETEARVRRQKLEQESSFYGAMDGANKFVRGDAIAGLIIIFINLIGGMIIGIIQRDLSFATAINTYTILTIGEGLVSQIPSLIISLSTGLVVTKSSGTGSIDKAIFGQLGKYPQSLFMTGIVTGMMSFLPGLPFIPFATLSIGVSILGYTIYNARAQSHSKDSAVSKTLQNQNEDPNKATDNAIDGSTDSDKVKDALHMDMIKIEIGYNLVPLVTSKNGNSSRLTEHIKALRKQIIQEYGFVIPSVHIQDSLQIGHNKYLIKVKELEAGQGEVFIDKLMVMDPQGKDINIQGDIVREPAFGLQAKWIEKSQREEALFNNYTVIDPATVITTHLVEIVKENIAELFSYTETQKLLEDISDDHKKLVKDVVPDMISIAMLQKVLQNLLSEMISIRDLPSILEAAAEGHKMHKTITGMTEFIRSRLSRQICHMHVNKDGFIPMIAMSHEWENTFLHNLIGDSEDKQLVIPPSKLQEFAAKVKKVYDEQEAKGGVVPVLLTSSAIRPYVRSIIERIRSYIPVMSQNEIHYKSKIKTLGSI